MGELVEEELWVEGAGRRKSCVNFGEREGQSVYIGFRVLEKLLHLCFFFFFKFKKVFFSFGFMFFFNIVMMWKIVKVLGSLVLYILAFNPRNARDNF